MNDAVQVVSATIRPGESYLVLTVTSGHDYQPTRIVNFGDGDSKVTFDGVQVDLADAVSRLTKPHAVVLHPVASDYGVSHIAEFSASQ